MYFLSHKAESKGHEIPVISDRALEIAAVDSSRIEPIKYIKINEEENVDQSYRPRLENVDIIREQDKNEDIKVIKRKLISGTSDRS